MGYKKTEYNERLSKKYNHLFATRRLHLWYQQEMDD